MNDEMWDAPDIVSEITSRDLSRAVEWLGKLKLLFKPTCRTDTFHLPGGCQIVGNTFFPDTDSIILMMNVSSSRSAFFISMLIA
jgi:hypothetical protein